MKYTIILLLFSILISCSSSNKFDKEVWKENANDKSDNPRYYMVKDLEDKYLKKGMSTKDILDLLDKPNHVEIHKDDIQWTYQIGSNAGFNIDPCSIVICFDTLKHYTQLDVIHH